MKELINLNYTISRELFEQVNNVWEVIPKIKDYILDLINQLDREKYIMIGDNIWIGYNVKISKKASITGPCIIDDNTEIRPNAYIRGNAIIGKHVVIGNSTEIKNSIIFDYAEVPHFNYIGDSILGYKAHLGAGTIISNLKHDKSNVIIKGEKNIETNLRKFGAVIGDNVNIGCNSVVFPGTIIYPNTDIYPLTKIRGKIEKNCIIKDEQTIIEKEKR